MSFIHFIELLVVVAVLLAIGIPLFSKAPGTKLFTVPEKTGEEYKHLLVRKEELLLSIKELELDFKIDKVSQEDYSDLRNKLEIEVTGILDRLDQLETVKKKGGKKNHPGQDDVMTSRQTTREAL